MNNLESNTIEPHSLADKQSFLPAQDEIMAATEDGKLILYAETLQRMEQAGLTDIDPGWLRAACGVTDKHKAKRTFNLLKEDPEFIALVKAGKRKLPADAAEQREVLKARKPLPAIPVEAEVLPSEPFAKEAAIVRREHAAVARETSALIGRMIRAGEALSRVKESLDHGEWGSWQKRNFPEISERTLRRYMEVFRRRNEKLALEDPVAFLAGIHGHNELVEVKPDAASDLKTPAPAPEFPIQTVSDLKRKPQRAGKAKKVAPARISTAAKPVPVSAHTTQEIDAFSQAIERCVREIRAAFPGWSYGEIGDALYQTADQLDFAERKWARS
jgi:hypothetical protein